VSDETLRALIDTGLQRRSAWRFPSDLENQYQARRGPSRRVRLSRTLAISAPLVLLTLLLDWLNAPALLEEAIPLRALLAALCIAAALLFPQLRRPWQETLAYGVPLLAMMVVTQILGQLGNPRVADRYMMAAVVVVAAFIATQPLPFIGALWVCGAATLLFPAMLWLVPGPIGLAANLDMPAFNAGVMAVVLLMSHRNEIARRLSFLAALRHELTAMEMSLLNAELLRLSSTDMLTGLANRRQFEFDLARHWADRRRTDLAVALVDVDYFKSFNDSAGHAAGDACLRRVATAIAGAMREGLDQAARYGGEEFAVLLPGATPGELEALGERLRRAVEDLALANPGRQDRPVTISVGMAWRAPANRAGQPDTLLREADRALYVAKNAGRNRVVLADAARLAATG
jgi:diguanylate cyclase (GGDEF)-like protein